MKNKCILLQISCILFSVIISTRLTIYADSGNICINCTISSLSDALGCVVLLHPVNDLSNITVREVNKSAQQPYCIYVGGGNTFSVAVFEWKSDGFIGFQPVTLVILNKISKLPMTEFYVAIATLSPCSNCY